MYQIMKICVMLLFVSVLTSAQIDNTINGNGERTRYRSSLRYPKRTSTMRTQNVFSNNLPFPCDVKTYGPSSVPPNSVHKLRPGDIKVIGAMGDSLIAGSGALGESIFYTIFEYRGVSWCIGGDGTWRDQMTLPNILKEFNPQLNGYSLGTGEYFFRDSHLNVAFPVASSLDAVMQAKVLVKRIMKDATIDFKNDWKMITVFFGANDICTLECFNKTAGSASGYINSITKALDYLQDNLPRTFVNLIPVLDVTVSVRIKRSIQCHLVHRLFCMCYHNQGYDPIPYMGAMARSYQRSLDNLIDTGRYDKRDDFTVVIQPFDKLFNLPKDPKRYLDEVMDISYITYDCFHFSQKGHAMAANLLWNNLLEPVGRKSAMKMDFLMQKFICPSQNAPYFFTLKNSKTFLETGRQ